MNGGMIQLRFKASRETISSQNTINRLCLRDHNNDQKIAYGKKSQARRSMCKASTDQTFGQLEFMQVFNCSFKYQ